MKTAYCPRAALRPSAARLLTTLFVVVSSVAVGACGSTMASLPLIGEPKNAPPRPEGAQAYPGVFVETAKPAESKMTTAERDKLKADLLTTRDTAAARKRDEINRSPPSARAKPGATAKKQATSPQKCEKEPCPR